MNTKKKLIVALATASVLGTAVFTTSSLMAHGGPGSWKGYRMQGQMDMGKRGMMMGQNQMGKRGMMGQNQMGKRGMMMGQNQYMIDSRTKARVETLALMSEKSEEEIDKLLQENPMPYVMGELKIDREQFHASMQSKMTYIIEEGVKEGKITEEEKKFMVTRMENHSPQNWNSGKRGMRSGKMRGHKMWFDNQVGNSKGE